MEPNELPQDFREFFELLNSEKVEYLLVGGFAVGLHGYTRATADIDAWVNPTPENAARVIRALERFGFAANSLSQEAFTASRKVFQIGVPPIRIDVLTSVSGLVFDNAYVKRVSADFGGVTVSLISLEDLKTNKRASGRNKDLADLDNLP